MCFTMPNTKINFLLIGNDHTAFYKHWKDDSVKSKKVIFFSSIMLFFFSPRVYEGINTF